jgi:hypothetical protein
MKLYIIIYKLNTKLILGFWFGQRHPENECNSIKKPTREKTERVGNTTKTV